MSADPHYAKEIALFIENDGELYRQQYRPIVLNYARKTIKGTFNKDRAIDGIIYLVENGKKKYEREFGKLPPMDKATKIVCAKLLYPGIMDEVRYQVNEFKKRIKVN